ncbi:hypothetical protein CK203_008405 [Vitis vinifera]|uniref:Uncharacterized protein n=1 Tax=Vitis vinifera TaxID=29760 RepID=A0A438KP03_VITVI|nr:hypothetical protein CK203_008405 [Vitis vinifera]
MIVSQLLAWSEELIKQRLIAEIREFSSLDMARGSMNRHRHLHMWRPREILEQYHEAEGAITTYQKGIQQQFDVMRELMHRLGAKWKEVYIRVLLVTLDIPIRQPAPDFHMEAGRSKLTLNDDEEIVVYNHFSLRYVILAPSKRGGRRWRMRQMVLNLLSPFIAQPQTRQSAIKMDMKQVVAIVFDGDLDLSEELVAMHDMSLSRGNLTSFKGDKWIGNDVVDAYCRMLLFEDVSKTKLFLSPYITVMKNFYGD